MNTKLRVFWTHLTLRGAIKRQYAREKRANDFPPGTKPSDAYAAIYKQYGQRDPDQAFNKPPPSQFAEIQGHRIVGEYERGAVETFEATEQNLLSDEALNACRRKI